MPLYEVTTKNGTERVRTVAGSSEDRRLNDSPTANLVDEPAASPERDVRRGRGRMNVNLGAAGTPAREG